MDPYEDSFRHDALFYAGEDEFLAGTVPFARSALERDEQVLVALGERNTAALRGELGGDVNGVTFTPMELLGRNPARIIPAWRDFVNAYAARGRPVRGIGEPIWPGRSAEEVVECHHHESLLNYAFDDGVAWWLLCSYDAERLDPDVLEAARHTHPGVVEAGVSAGSDRYLSPAEGPGPFDGPLSDPPAQREELPFSSPSELSGVRAFVSSHATAAGISRQRVNDLVLAIDELATNSLRHAGGEGRLTIWRQPDALVCEVTDDGRIEWPLTGRVRPLPEQVGGRGVWIVNQLCDLVQIRALPDGNVARVQMRAG